MRIGTIRGYAMRRIVRNFPALVCAGFLLLCAGKGFSQTNEVTYYVSTAGSDTHDGRTVGTAYRTIGKAAAVVKAGDLVWIRGGTYREYVRLLNSGTSSARITFEAFPGERPVLDGSDLPTDLTNPWNQPPVLSIGGRYVTVRGLEIRNGASHGITVGPAGADAILDQLHVHHVYAVGIHLYLTWDVTISNSRIHDAYDYGAEGNDADCINAGGYSAHGRHIIRDNEVYNCADDGIDVWTSSGNVITGNVVHHAGMGFRGDGNGFKLGPGGSNIVRHNVAYENRNAGFTPNDGGQNKVFNNTAYRNGIYNFVNYTQRNAYKNNLSVEGLVLMDTFAAHRNNSWNLGVTDPRFETTDPGSALFLRLAQGSPAIDKGLGGIGEFFAGSAPDLGAYEYGSPPSPEPPPLPEPSPPPPASRCLLVPLTLGSLTSDGGVAFVLAKTFGIPADDTTHPTRSQLRLFEGENELRLSHAVHNVIRLLGGGRFSHWSAFSGPGGEGIRFSASDNTDSRTNARTYSYCLGAGTPFNMASVP
jgi:parallel beta-helix repeat protein